MPRLIDPKAGGAHTEREARGSRARAGGLGGAAPENKKVLPRY